MCRDHLERGQRIYLETVIRRSYEVQGIQPGLSMYKASTLHSVPVQKGLYFIYLSTCNLESFMALFKASINN